MDICVAWAWSISEASAPVSLDFGAPIASPRRCYTTADAAYRAGKGERREASAREEGGARRERARTNPESESPAETHRETKHGTRLYAAVQAKRLASATHVEEQPQ